MQKKINYFLFIVQGRGFHQRVELDCPGVAPRFVVLPTVNHILGIVGQVVGVIGMVSGLSLVGKS
jgi:hypothetical protein|tara:strand:+ start:359 stop:553 length:195 start_codon:yes stop_codon:yes gene_type:complete